jgi:hypothetical protein
MSSHYYRELYQKLQGLSQGIKNVDEYFKEMELAMIRANIEKDREATMTKFINELYHDMTHIMELYHYVLEEMMHMTMKVERQLKRKSTIWQS